MSFCFNAPRFIAFSRPLLAGTLITYWGDYGTAAVIISMIYVLGIVAKDMQQCGASQRTRAKATRLQVGRSFTANLNITDEHFGMHVVAWL